MGDRVKKLLYLKRIRNKEMKKEKLKELDFEYLASAVSLLIQSKQKLNCTDISPLTIQLITNFSRRH